MTPAAPRSQTLKWEAPRVAAGYLKSVYAAVVADIGDFPRQQANQGIGHGK